MVNERIEALRELVDTVARYETALRRLANLNNGPDLASASYRCEEAARIAEEALRGQR